jgi:Fur family zinc uptake transcriptional regulator
VRNSLLKRAEEHCAETGSRFTAPRAAVLGVVLRVAAPLSAYDILDEMPAGTKPQTVYRALEFWQKEGFIHHIGSLNAYVACRAGHRHTGAQFLICDHCGSIAESHMCHMPRAFSNEAREKDFSVRHWVLELHGHCRKCGSEKSSPGACRS